jgi:hypothetical protein
MSLKINPASVRLGKDGALEDNRYVASYLPVDKASLPLSCALPPEVAYVPGDSTLIPLNRSCSIAFPDVLAIPPVYNPTTVQFSSCETLNAYTEITTTAATKNTTLSLVASGPTISPDGGPTDCSLKLVGLFDVTACADFAATSDIIFAGAASGSSIVVESSSAPNCGTKLTGIIDIDACETFTASADNITFGPALKGSYLTVEAAGTPNCGFDLSGNLNVNACETFDAKATIQVRGNPVKKSAFTVAKTSLPNCGFNLTGDVLIEACTDFTATSAISFTGAAVKSNTLKLSSTGQPNCGINLTGDVTIDACATFNASNTLKIGGSAVSTVKPITLKSTSTPACGFSLDGEINIDACTNTSITVVTNTTSPGSITLRTDVPSGQSVDKGKAYSSAKLVPRGKVLWQNGCDMGIMITMDSINLEIPNNSIRFDTSKKSGSKSGCSWQEDTDSVGIVDDKDSGTVYVGGSQPIPCFACDTAQYTASGDKPFLFSDLELKSLSIEKITTNQCCQIDGDNSFDLCFEIGRASCRERV